MKMRLKFSYLMAILCVSASFSVLAKQNPPGCRNANAAKHNPNCHPQTTQAISQHPPSVVVSSSTQNPQSLGNVAPIVVTGTYGPGKTGLAPVPPNKTHKPDDGKYMTPQHYAVPPKPQAKPQVVIGIYGPTWSGFSPVLPNKTHKPDDGKYMTPQHYAVPPKPQAKPQVVIGTYGPAWSGFSPVVVMPQKGAKPKHPHIVNVHTTQAKNPDHHPNHHIPSVAGKGMVDGHRSQFVQANGHIWTCALSGMSRRVIKDQGGKSRLVGHAETLHFRDSTTAHLPSNHRLEANCLVTVNKHAKQ